MNKVGPFSKSFLALPNDKIHLTLCNGISIDISFNSYTIVEVLNDTPNVVFHTIELFQNGRRRDE